MKMEEITATVEKQSGFKVTWEWERNYVAFNDQGEVVAEYDPKTGQILIKHIKGGV